MEQIFNSAATHLQTLVDKLPQSTKESDLLYLYARYKQATAGPCDTPKPGIFNVAARKKWCCWNDLKQMSKEQAMLEYVDKIRLLDPAWDQQSTTVRSGMGVAVSVMLKADEEKLPDDDEKDVFDWCKDGSLKNVVKLLPSPFPKDDEDRTLLHWACDRGCIDIVQYLVDEGHDVNCKDIESSTPLHYASSCDHFDIALFLLQHHANPSCKDEDGETPVDCAISEKMKTLLEKHARDS